MKTKYLGKLNEMIKDVDKIKQNEDPKKANDTERQYDEIKKKLTLLVRRFFFCNSLPIAK